MDPIQGSDAQVLFYNNQWTPYVCASDVTVNIEGDLIQTRTKGDGNWKKYSYATLGWNITLNGVMVFNDTNFRDWDILQNQAAVIPLQMQVMYTDDLGNAKSIRGVVLVKTTALSASVGQVVKGSHTFQGSGKLEIFDGFDPCSTNITSVTVFGQTDASGIVKVDYTYAGDLAQVKYQIDGVGSWIYAQGAVEIDIPKLTLGAHTIEIIPVCSNGYEGVPFTEAFLVTQALVCNTVITISVDTTALTAKANVTSGTATQMNYSIDGGTPTTVPIGQVISIATLSPGNHTISMTPICLINGQQLPATTVFQNFTITSQPQQSQINYSFSREIPTIGYKAFFNLYVNGNSVASGGASASGSINVAVGADIRMEITVITGVGQPVDPTAELVVQDQTLGTTVSSQSQTGSPATLTYEFTANGHTFNVFEDAIL